MAWLIVSNDNENGPAIRADEVVMDAHWQYELTNTDVILAAGSLRKDDGVTKNGSVLSDAVISFLRSGLLLKNTRCCCFVTRSLMRPRTAK